MYVPRSLIGVLCCTAGWLSLASQADVDCLGLTADVVCGGGVCNGTAMDDVIVGTNGVDEINALGGNDVVCGRSGDDTIFGGPGDDIIHGNRGADVVRGGPGDDLLVGGHGTDVCHGGAGDDDEGLLDGFSTCEGVSSIEGFLNTCTLTNTCTLIETSVSPATTDPAIDDPVGGNHLIYVNPAAPPRDEILVHFPGTSGTPAGNSVFLQAVANQGMRAIGLQYVNDGPVNGVCLTQWMNNPPADPDCQENLRLERVYGVDASPLENVSPANSLVNRLTKLLEYLDAQQPELAWGDYLNDGAPRWDHIVVSGHSQGSGMAALIARDETVARVMMFGGPSDFDPLGNSSDWMTDPKATPIGDHYGFRHQNDQQFPVMSSWDDMELPGPPIIVDASNPPFAGSHFLETNIAVPPGEEHGSVIRNTQLEANGAPTFRDVWEYMCCLP